MTDETEGEYEVEVAQPDPAMIHFPSGTYVVPDFDALGELLGSPVVALCATDAGLFYLSPARRWEPVELQAKPASVRPVK